ncbi:MAG: TonB-dependent receptor [Acidobacteriota bacterium]|nr:TonB-dependent receptor [Acidobacteriota bacterium]
MKPVTWKFIQLRLVGCFATLIALAWPVAAQIQTSSLTGTLFYESGEPVMYAALSVYNSQGVMLQKFGTDNHGRFSFSGLPPGSYLLKILTHDEQFQQLVIQILPEATLPLDLKFTPTILRSEITITAKRGELTEAESVPPVVSVVSADDFGARPLATIGNALDTSAGVMVQQSTFGQVSPFLRGLTGYQVLNLLDGIRFNNATFRSGPNQYLAFIEPSQVQRIEAMLGPASSQYGSDALGGAIQLATRTPEFGGRNWLRVNGEVQTFVASADASMGADAKLSVGSELLAWLVGGNWRKHNDLRAGGGNDSRHVFKRFFGLSDELIRGLTGSRQQDTGFAQFGGFTKLAARLSSTQNLTLWFQRNQMDGVRAYKDLWGGLGRLRSDFDPQSLQFFYARHEKLKLGFLDSLNTTFSINSQNDGSARQGLKATDRITRDDSRVNVFGYAAQATTHIGKRQALFFGGEIYDEHIAANRDETDPQTGIPIERRALYPNGSRYTTFGAFGQNSIDLIRGKLRATFGGRYTRIRFQTFANQNRDAAGNNFGVIDSLQSFDDLTFNANVSWQMTSALSLNFLTGRGFRAPNLNDLGALGLNDLGFEIPSEAAASAGALIGTSDGEGVGTNGRKVSSLRAETLFNYEFGATLRLRRLYLRAQVFDAELKDPIVRRTLLFPAATVPAQLAGISATPIAQTAAQRAQNVVSVATALDPRAVKTFVNEGAAKYYGVETLMRYTISPRWSAEANYSFLFGRELNPNRNIRRLPPQQGFAAVRFQPAGKLWLELSGNFSGAQNRLSGGDLTDERIGAARRRRDINDFFQSALAQPFIQPGADGLSGTADDVLAATGETVAQIRNRVLPIGVTINGVTISDDNSRAPLYTSNAGFAALNIRGGLIVHENITLNLALMNFTDRNYRVHGSGVDAPGINLFVGLKFRF